MKQRGTSLNKGIQPEGPLVKIPNSPWSRRTSYRNRYSIYMGWAIVVFFDFFLIAGRFNGYVKHWV